MAKRNWIKVDAWSSELAISEGVRVLRRSHWKTGKNGSVKKLNEHDVQEWHIERGVGEIGWVTVHTFSGAQSAIDAANTVARRRGDVLIGVK